MLPQRTETDVGKLMNWRGVLRAWYENEQKRKRLVQDILQFLLGLNALARLGYRINS